MFFKFIVIFISTFFIISCATERKEIVSNPASVKVSFLNKGINKDTLGHKNNPLSKLDLKKEIAVSLECNTGEEFAGAGAIIAFVVDKVVSFAVDKIDDALQEELEKYTQSFTGTSFQQFNLEGNEYLNIVNKCIRITRAYKDKTGKVVIAMDFIAKLEDYKKESVVLAIKPLRLYYKKPQAKTNSSHKYGVSIGLNMNVMWRESHSPKFKEKAVEKIILADQFILDQDANKYVYRTYKELKSAEQDFKPSKSVKPIYVPMIPWSHYDEKKFQPSYIQAQMIVSEVGNPPWWLKKGASLVNDNKDKISENVKSAINKLIQENVELGEDSE